VTSDASGKHTLQPRGARTDSVYDERVSKVARGAQTKPNQDNALAFSKLEARFASDARVTRGGKGFGATALKLDGKIFAMLTARREFVVKLPRERVTELVNAGRGRPFEAGKGKPMREWLVVEEAPARWFSLAQEARAFVASG